MKRYRILFQEKGVVKKLYVEDIEKLPKNVIEIKEFKKSFSFKLDSKIDVLAFIKEINIMLEAGIKIVEALEILNTSTNNKKLKVIISLMISSLKKGKPIHKSIERYKKDLGSQVVDFFRIGESYGSLSASLKALEVILFSISENKKRLKTALSYPLILISVLFFSVSIIFTLVLPKVENIFNSLNGELPFYTRVLLDTKEFFQNNILFIVLAAFSFFSTIFYLYKSDDKIRAKVDKVLIKTPIVGSFIKTKTFYQFFLVLSILLDSKYKFQIALKSALGLVKNEELKKIFSKIETQIQKGESIYKAFKKSNLFDEVTLSLINTGENSNRLDLVFRNIQKNQKSKLEANIKMIIKLIEPFFIFMIVFFISWIMLAVFTPMWSMNEIIK